MDRRYHIAALREVHLMVSEDQSARGTRTGTVTRPSDNGSETPGRLLCAVLAAFSPAIVVVMAAIAVIKEVLIM